MRLTQSLLFKLSKKYDPSALVETKYKGKDLLFKTDDQGNPIVLFIGRLADGGKIRGERYVRTLIRDTKGIVVKDHWELKGNAD